jgi:hypothetical protein
MVLIFICFNAQTGTDLECGNQNLWEQKWTEECRSLWKAETPDVYKKL